MDDDERDYVDLEDHFARMVLATQLLRQIKTDAEYCRFQFGEALPFVELVDEIKTAQETWIASNC